MNHITFFIPNLGYGGAERVTVNLLKALSEHDVVLDLVLTNLEAPSPSNYLDEVPRSVKVINLATGRISNSILPLANYIRECQPHALISHLSYANVAAVFAKQLARTKTRLVLVEHNTVSAHKSTGFTSKLVKSLMKLTYPQAEFIVTVSEAASRDLEKYLGFESGRVKTIYNPIVGPDLFTKSNTSLDHPWFQSDSTPVFLAVGRLVELKDFSTLIQAFALLRKVKNSRLVILGDGELRDELENLAKALGISEDVWLAGFVDNPYVYMRRATALVLSSRSEGLPNVLIEAMACGCPVISTDCFSGPREILDSGKYGALVPVGDVQAMSQAMLEVLEQSVNKQQLIQRALDIASFEKAASEYLELLDS